MTIGQERFLILVISKTNKIYISEKQEATEYTRWSKIKKEKRKYIDFRASINWNI